MRKKEKSVRLPDHVRRIKARGKDYFYWHPFRGTPDEIEAVRLPNDPFSVEFAVKIAELSGEDLTTENTINGMVDAYLASAEFALLKPATQKDYTGYLNKLKGKIGLSDPRNLQVKEVSGIKDAMKKTPVAANHYITVIKVLYNWGVEKGRADTNPAAQVTRLQPRTRGRKPWPLKLFQLSQKHFRSELRIACALGWFTGQRLADVLTMRLSDIKNGRMTGIQSKTGKPFSVRIHVELMPTIKEAKKRGNIYIVSRDDGRPFSTQDFQAMWTGEMKKEPHGEVRQQGYSFHGLRKSMTVNLVEKGATTRQVQSVTKSSRGMVDHYSQGADDEAMADYAIKLLED
jgi:integrase